MGRLVINNAMSVNGAFEAPVPEPDGWLVLDADSNQVSLEQFLTADAMVLGRKTYEGLAAVWPQLADDPTLGVFADQMNSMPKFVASKSLREPLEWNATLLEGDLAESVTALKDRHDRTLVAVGAGELARDLTLGLVDEFWFWVSPSLWPAGLMPRPGVPTASRVPESGLKLTVEPVKAQVGSEAISRRQLPVSGMCPRHRGRGRVPLEHGAASPTCKRH